MISFTLFLKESKEKKTHGVIPTPIHFKYVPKKKIVYENVLSEKSLPHLDDLPGQIRLGMKRPAHNDYAGQDEVRWSDQGRKYRWHHIGISSDLHKGQEEPTRGQKTHIKKYSAGDTGGDASSVSGKITKKLIENHKNGKAPTEGMSKGEKNIHETISSLASKPIGKEVHLYSGVGFNPSELANKSKDKVIHSPAHISATHEAEIARSFTENHDEKHIMHIHMKPHDKGFHVGSHSENDHEHETIIPAGTKLKYHNTTQHVDDDGNTHNVHHFTIHSQE